MAFVLDAFPLIGYLLGDEAARDVGSLMHRDRVTMSPVNLAEVIDVLERRREIDRRDVEAGLAPLIGAGLEILAVTGEHAWLAATLRSRHYRRRESELSLADCFLLAQGAFGYVVVTTDPPVARAARTEGIDVFALPDSRGRRP